MSTPSGGSGGNGSSGYPYSPDNPFQDWYPARNNPNLDHATNEAIFIAFQDIYALRRHVTTVTQQITTPAPAGAIGGGAGAGPAPGLVIGFGIFGGSPGTNVGPMLAAPRSGSVSQCVICTKASDATTALSFRIKQNGTSVFTTNPSVAAGTAGGTVSLSGTLTSSPLTVTASDVFSIDILTGSLNWQFTAQLE